MKTVNRTVFAAAALVALSSLAFGAGTMGGYSDPTSGTSRSTIGDDNTTTGSPGEYRGSGSDAGTTGYTGSGAGGRTDVDTDSEMDSYQGSGAGGPTGSDDMDSYRGSDVQSDQDLGSSPGGTMGSYSSARKDPHHMKGGGTYKNY